MVNVLYRPDQHLRRPPPQVLKQYLCLVARESVISRSSLLCSFSQFRSLLPSPTSLFIPSNHATHPAISPYLISVGTVSLVIAVLSKAPTHQSAKFVFATFIDGTGVGEPAIGWSQRASPAYVAVIGILMAQYTLTGFDASAHVSTSLCLNRSHSRGRADHDNITMMTRS